MATIRGLQRRQLVSSAVGTPGLDFSDARALSSLANNTTRVLQQIDANNAITNQTEAIKLSQEINAGAQQGIAAEQARANADSSINLSDSMQIQQGIYDKAKERGLANIRNKDVRSIVSLQLEKNRVSSFNSIAKWGVKRQAINHLTNGTAAVNALSSQAEGDISFDDLTGLLQQGAEISKFTAAGVSEKEGAKFIANTPESITKAYFNGLIKRDPERGLQELLGGKTKSTFDVALDSDDRKEIENNLINAKNGLDKRNNYFSQQRLASTFSEASVDPSVLDDINWLNSKKNELTETGQMTPQIESDLNKQIDTVLKQNKLEAKRDLKTLQDLSTEFVNFGINKTTGEIKGDVESFTDYFNFAMRLGQARADGKINDDDYMAMSLPLQIAIEHLASEKQVEGEGLISRAVEAITAIVKAGLFGDFINGWNFQQNPINFGVNQVDEILTNLELEGGRKSQVRGAMLADLFEAFSTDMTNKTDVTTERISSHLKRINRDISQRFNLPIFSEGNGPIRFNTELNRVEQQQQDGSWELVKE